MQLLFWRTQGIVSDGEAEKYIYQAEQFLENGRFTSLNYLFYSTLIMLIALCMKLNISLGAIVVLQMILNGLSIIAFYKIMAKSVREERVRIGATLFFLLFYYYHLFNVFIYTESLFFSLSVIYTWFLFSLNRFDLKNGILVFLFLTLLYFTRPTGIYFITATALYLVIRFFSAVSKKWVLAGGIGGAILLVFLLNFSLGSGGGFNFLLPYSEQMIICGVPTVDHQNEIMILVNHNSLQGLLFIISKYPGLFFSLAFQRLMAFFGAMRTFYSTPHNLILAFYFYPAYGLIIYRFRKLFRQNTAQNCFMLCVVLLMCVTVALSCDEWSNRFLFSVSPFLFLLAAQNLSGMLSADRRNQD